MRIPSNLALVREAHKADEERRWWFDVRDFELEKMMHARGITSSVEAGDDWPMMVATAERTADALVHDRGALVEPSPGLARGQLSRRDAVGDAHGADRGAEG